MLRLTLEIVPFGIEAGKRPIGMMHVGLQRVDPGNVGQYRVYCYKETGELVDEFEVLDHDRDNGAWELIRRAVEIYCDPALEQKRIR